MIDTREQDSYPLTWEVPAGIAAAIALVGVGGVHLGRALANLTVGAPWAWPATDRVFTSLTGVLAGDANAGLAAPHQSAPPWLLLTWIIATLIAALVVGTLAGRWITSRWGPGAVRGTATVSQARDVLGVRRLHRHQRIIRPDLARPRRRTR